MTRKIKVVYSDKIDKELDRKIRVVMERLGARWYAQGYNLESRERDLCFDLKESEWENGMPKIIKGG